MKVIAYSLGMVAVSRALIWYILPLELIQFFTNLYNLTFYINEVHPWFLYIELIQFLLIFVYTFLMLIIFTKLIKNSFSIV